MDIQKLQALAVIQEAGSFSRAAETLGYSQAGLTYMMNSLENEIGLRLLDRSYSGVRLSETGKTLMPKIHRLLQFYDALNGEINACKCAQQATLRLAALDTVSTRWVPRAVAALKSEYPQITVSVISGSPMQVDNWLRDGSVELGVTDKRFTGTDMDWIRLCDDPFLLSILAHHNKRRLNCRHTRQHQIQQNKRIWVKRLGRQQSIDNHPKN